MLVEYTVRMFATYIQCNFGGYEILVRKKKLTDFKVGVTRIRPSFGRILGRFFLFRASSAVHTTHCKIGNTINGSHVLSI